MNSKMKTLRELIRAEIKKSIAEDDVNAAASDPKIQSLYKQLNQANIESIKIQMTELQTKLSAITKNMATQGAQKDLATLSTQAKKAIESKSAAVQAKITGLKKQIADLADTAVKKVNVAAK